jgi:hypothetical protein
MPTFDLQIYIEVDNKNAHAFVEFVAKSNFPLPERPVKPHEQEGFYLATRQYHLAKASDRVRRVKGGI